MNGQLILREFSETGVIYLQMNLGKNSVWLWRISATLIALPAFFFCGIFLLLFPPVGKFLFVLCSALYLCYMLWYVPRLFGGSRVMVNKGQLNWQTGVFVKTGITLGLKNILTASVSRSPLQQLLGLCTLAVRPVGAPILMRQLSRQDAQVLQRMIEEAANE